MRNRHSGFSLAKPSSDLLGALGCLVGALIIIWLVPPIHIGIVFILSLLVSGGVYFILKRIIIARIAYIVSLGLCFFMFLYGIDMLDIMNSLLLISLLASIGVLVYQR